MKLFFGAVAAAAVAATSFGLTAIASAAPSGPASVDATVSQLRAQGYQVIVNRTGAAALDHCTVHAIRPGQTFSRSDSGAPGAGNDIVTTVTNKTVYLDVVC